MPASGPLAVRLSDGTVDRPITKYVDDDLTFTRTAPGGYHSAQLTVHLPLAVFPDLGPGDHLWISDTTTARVVWEGFLDNPGVTDGPDGQSFDLSCLGTGILTSDESRPLLYVDTSLDGWQAYTGPGSPTSAVVSTGGNPTVDSGAASTDQGVTCQIGPGVPIATNDVAKTRYVTAAAAGLAIAAVSGVVLSGKADTTYQTDLTDPAADQVLLTSRLFTAAQPFTVYAAPGSPSTGLSTGQTSVALNLRRTGPATNVADALTWSYFDALTVIGRRVDLNGNPVDGAAAVASATYVQADWVAADVIGRLIPVADPVTSTVITLDPATAYQINQLTYPDGATADDVLTDLETYEPTLLHEVLESGPNGYRVNVRAWPTDVRYVLTKADGYDAPGGEATLANRVTVYWTDLKGVRQATVTTATSATYPALSALEQQGRIKDADSITLPEGHGSATNAARAGAQALAIANMPALSATVTVKHRVLDRATGCWVQPWAIEAGYLAQVRETGDVLPITATTYERSSGSAALTLGYPVLEDDDRIAQLYRRLRKTTA